MKLIPDVSESSAAGLPLSESSNVKNIRPKKFAFFCKLSECPSPFSSKQSEMKPVFCQIYTFWEILIFSKQSGQFR